MEWVGVTIRIVVSLAALLFVVYCFIQYITTLQSKVIEYMVLKRATDENLTIALYENTKALEKLRYSIERGQTNGSTS